MATERCAAHPGRPAVDTCPVCALPRCGVDSMRAPGGGCTLCAGGKPAPGAARDPRELLVRALLAANAVAVVWGYVTAEYVGAEIFKYLSPMVLGVLCGGAASAAAANPSRGRLSQQVRLLSVLYAVLGSALGFVLEGTYTATDVSIDVLVPYLIAAAAAWLYTAPPGRKKT